MSQPTMQSTISSDGSLAAVIVPTAATSNRLLIQIYQVGASSCSLQLTLAHSTSNPLKEIVFCGNAMVVGLMGTSEVVVWDLERGVVANKLMASSEEQSFLAVAGGPDGKHFSILTRHSQKLYVYDYLASSNKLTRKMKSGRFEGESDDAFLAISESHVVVQTSAGARIMDRDTGKKVGKIKAKQLSRILICPNDSNIMAGLENSGAIVLYDISTCKKITSVAQVLPSSSSYCALQLTKNEDDESYTLLADQTIYNIEDDNAEKLTQLNSTQPAAAFLVQDKLLALVHQKTGGCVAEYIDLDEVDSITKLDEVSSQDNNAEATKQNSKRKTTEPMILGPGQAGSEIAPPTKKAKANKTLDDEDENDEAEEESPQEISIAERLQQLSNVMDEYGDDEDDEGDEEVESTFKFKPKKATTESLKELLSQALQSSDENLLELALAVRDVKVISTTLKEIEPSLILVLVSKLTQKLASTPLRAESLATWLSHCLKTGRFQPHHLSALRNLLFERIESFSDLLRLEGRLSMMCDVE